MTHSPHTIVTVGKNQTRFCPECKADWRSSAIPEKSLHLYGENDGYFSRLIGVEIREKYDGVDHWKCPDCQATFKRW
jgi:rubredoxin